jgi:hypothetical protein
MVVAPWYTRKRAMQCLLLRLGHLRVALALDCRPTLPISGSEQPLHPYQKLLTVRCIGVVMRLITRNPSHKQEFKAFTTEKLRDSMEVIIKIYFFHAKHHDHKHLAFQKRFEIGVGETYYPARTDHYAASFAFELLHTD